MIRNGQIALAINTSDNVASKNDAKIIRQSVLSSHIPCFTTIAAARATAMVIREIKGHEAVLEPKALQEYLL